MKLSGKGKIDHMNKQSLILFLVMLLSLLGCLEVIDFETEIQPKLTIFGQITDSYTFGAQVTVQQSAAIISASRVDNIKSAIVRIVDQQGNETRLFFNEESQCYATRRVNELSVFVGIPGQCYQLLVTVSNQNFQSEWACIPSENIQTVSKFVIKEKSVLSPEQVPITKKFVEVYQDISVAGLVSASFTRWNIDELYFVWYPKPTLGGITPTPCYIINPYRGSKIPILSTQNNTNSEIDDFLLAEKAIDRNFMIIYHFAVVRHSIDQDAYLYWEKVNSLVNRTGSLFESPPANLNGNISSLDPTIQNPLGYFEASKVDTSLVKISRSDLPFYIPNEQPTANELSICSEIVPFYLK